MRRGEGVWLVDAAAAVPPGPRGAENARQTLSESREATGHMRRLQSLLGESTDWADFERRSKAAEKRVAGSPPGSGR